MLKLAILFFIFFSNVIHSKIENCFERYLDKSKFQQLRNIDFIYMVNSDERAEKHKSSLEQLVSSGIIPCRFSAVNGWNLLLETTNSIGIPYELWMQGGIWRTSYSIIMEYTQSDQIRLFSLINNVISAFPRVFTDNGKPNYLNKVLMALTI